MQSQWIHQSVELGGSDKVSASGLSFNKYIQYRFLERLKPTEGLSANCSQWEQIVSFPVSLILISLFLLLGITFQTSFILISTYLKFCFGQHDHSLSSVQFSSVTQSCPTLCYPMNHSMPGLPVHHQLPESTQTHVHQFTYTIQPSHPLPSPCPPALNLSQHQGLFQWVRSSQSGGQSIGVSVSTSVLSMNTQDWSPLGWTGWISWQSKGHSRVFSNTTVQKHQFCGAQLSSQSKSHIHTWPLEKP